jgi:hypothetical protein
MAALADTAETEALESAKQSIDHALALAEDRTSSRADLARALYLLAYSCRAAVDVAECRGERITEGE